MSTKNIHLFSRQDFFDKVFRKSGSYNSLNGARSAISNLDTFCTDVYQKDTDDVFSEIRGIEINPHLLRSIFTDKCTRAGIKDKYIDAFCGRTPKGVLAKHYSDYSVESLAEQYEKVEDLLTLDK